MPDIVADILAVAFREAGVDPDPDARLRTETAIRMGWGGDRVHIRKKEPPAERYRAIRADLDGGMTHRKVAKKHGVSLRTCFRAAKSSGDE